MILFNGAPKTAAFGAGGKLWAWRLGMGRPGLQLHQLGQAQGSLAPCKASDPPLESGKIIFMPTS